MNNKNLEYKYGLKIFDNLNNGEPLFIYEHVPYAKNNRKIILNKLPDGQLILVEVKILQLINFQFY